VRDHQHVPRFGIGDDRSDETVGAELRRERQAFFDLGLISQTRLALGIAGS
jgi:hypothetical protein